MPLIVISLFDSDTLSGKGEKGSRETGEKLPKDPKEAGQGIS